MGEYIYVSRRYGMLRLIIIIQVYMASHPTLFFLLLGSVFCVLDIYEPKQAKDTLGGITIGYTVANFGHIPYGKSMIGNLVVVTPLENCQIAATSSIPTYDSTFLLIKRGNCSFVHKVMNAEKLGAKLAIIMDNVQQNTGYLTMKDDGNGYLVNIPSVLISDNDGQRLMSLSHMYNPLTMKITFDTQKTQKVNMTIYTQANNRMTYHFVRSFSEYYPALQKYVNFKVIPHSISCYFCKPSDCVVEGRYCSINYDLKTAVTGKDVVKQQLREQIVSRDYLDKWWDYMDQFDLECDNLLEAQVCSAKLFKKLNIDADEVERKLTKQLQTQQILSFNAGDLQYSGTFSYPSVLINNQRYLGNLKASYVFEQICSTLTTAPSECGLSNESHTSSWVIVFLVILTAFILFSVIFYFYRRHLNRELSLNMSSQVSEQVSKYIQFYSSRNNQ